MKIYLVIYRYILYNVNYQFLSLKTSIKKVVILEFLKG